MMNELPSDREYYQEQFGLDSLSEDNCSYEQAAEFIEFLDKQSMELGSNGTFQPEEEVVEPKEQLL